MRNPILLAGLLALAAGCSKAPEAGADTATPPASTSPTATPAPTTQAAPPPGATSGPDVGGTQTKPGEAGPP